MISDAMFFIPEQFDEVGQKLTVEGEWLNAFHKSYSEHDRKSEKICSPKAEKTSYGTQIHKSRWTSDEDKKLAEAVKIYGACNWGKISEVVGSRSGKQCRERWIVHHDPAFTREEWTKEEDQILLDLHSQIGNKWSSISQFLKGRSTTNIKNRFKFLRNHNLVPKINKCNNPIKSEIIQTLDALPEQDISLIQCCQPDEFLFDEFIPIVY